ncbi:hypothetical protein [Azospirillum endophyticum]
MARDRTRARMAGPDCPPAAARGAHANATHSHLQKLPCRRREAPGMAAMPWDGRRRTVSLTERAFRNRGVSCRIGASLSPARPWPVQESRRKSRE